MELHGRQLIDDEIFRALIKIVAAYFIESEVVTHVEREIERRLYKSYMADLLK